MNRVIPGADVFLNFRDSIRSIRSQSKKMSKLNVFVKSYTGETISLEVEPSIKVEDIKTIIQQQADIPKSYQNLFYGGIMLEDRNSLDYYSVQTESTILCETAVLLVATPNNQILTLNITSACTAEMCKKMVEDQTGVLKENQRLFYACCSLKGKQLADCKTIVQNEIKGHFILMAEVYSGFKVFVECLKKTRSIFTIKCTLMHTVADISLRATEKLGRKALSVEHMIFYKDNKLEANKTLGSYNIQNEHVLQLTEGTILYVKRLPGYHNFKIDVKKSDTVKHIKMIIEEKEKIPHYWQKIYFHGQLLENSKTLADYSIGFGMKIELQVGLRIIVFRDGYKKLQLDIKPLSTIFDVKMEIKRLIHVLVKRQQLVLKGIELDNERSIHYNEITDFTALHLKIKESMNTLDLYVYHESCAECGSVEVNPSVTVEILRVEIEKSIHASLDNYRIFYNRQSLESNKTISTYGIKNFSKLFLIKNDMEPMFIKVITLTGKIHIIPSYSNDTVRQLKTKIKNLDGIPLKQQRLIYAGFQLVDDLTLSRYNIVNDSKVHLVLRLTGC